MTLKKKDCIEKIANKGFSKARSAQILETLLEIMKSTLEKGENILISGFGKFYINSNEARRGRTPMNENNFPPDAKRVVAFKCSPMMKKKINSWEIEVFMPRVIIIDDDPQIRSVLHHMFERTGYEVADASNGNEWLRLHREKAADLIIVDILMPEKDGIETIIELRRGTPEVKVIAISGGGRIKGEEYLEMANGLGATRTLRKPFHREEILNIAKELISWAL